MDEEMYEVAYVEYKDDKGGKLYIYLTNGNEYRTFIIYPEEKHRIENSFINSLSSRFVL